MAEMKPLVRQLRDDFSLCVGQGADTCQVPSGSSMVSHCPTSSATTVTHRGTGGKGRLELLSHPTFGEGGSDPNSQIPSVWVKVR